jgi:hypothetical protein
MGPETIYDVQSAKIIFFSKFYQTLISTSTPLGSSSFIRASTVFGVEL